MLMILSVVGALPSAVTATKSKDIQSDNKDFSHNSFGEYFTMTTCIPCKYSHSALKQLYAGGWKPFYYITYVYNVGNVSKQRKNELDVVGSPTVVWDGGYRYDTGGSDNETEMARYNESINKCGARDVKDIDLSLNVEWLGAVNNVPEDEETDVIVEQILSWTISEMKIDVEVTNNEASQYNGHLHVQVTEVNSTWYDDKWGDPYTFEFKNYAVNQDITLSGGGSWDKTVYWDGYDYHDGDSPPHYFGHIIQENIMVIASVSDEDNDNLVDETAGFRAGDETDPKTFDVYFGDSNPPPKVASNSTRNFYDPYGPSGLLNFSTEYYWKIDVWDDQDNPTFGDTWSFTTRANNPPNTPDAIYPINNSKNIPINADLIWSGDDPDGDNTTYDVFFGEYDPFEDPPLVSDNVTTKSFDPSPDDHNLKFLTKYAWKIVAWDKYGLSASSPIFTFTTQENVPPDPAKNPIPPDGANNIPSKVTLYWNGSDPNPGDELTYDVYFGPNDPPAYKTTQEKNNWTTYEMPLFEKFYWRIDTRDREGEQTDGYLWTFTTGVNPPPTDPEIDGPTEGLPDVEYNFTFVSTDPDEQNISYYVDWGDKTNSGWTDFYYSGEEITLNHTWSNGGTYTIKAKARDIYEEPTSDWSEHEINIPRNRAVNYNNNLLNWLFERFPRMFQLLKFLLGL